MEKTIGQQLLNVDELIQRNRCADAADRLDIIKTDRLNDEEYAFYCLLLAETRLRTGRYDIEEILNRAIAFYKKGIDHELFARAKYLYGWYLVSIGKHFEAREILMESYLNYQRCDNLNAVTLVLNRLAQVQFQTGAIDDAIRNLERCVEINQALGRYDNVIAFSANIAVVLLRTGALTEALRRHESILDDIHRIDDECRGNFFLTYAMVTALKGDVDTALELIAKATRFIDRFKRSQAHYYEYLGWIHILNGEFGKAEKILKIGLKLSLELAPHSTLITQVRRLLSETYVCLGKYALAKRSAREGLRIAEALHEQAEMAGYYRVLARIEQAAGDADAARQRFKEAIDIYSTISSRYELAVTRYLAATSGLYDAGGQLAMLYMAREYFSSEKLEHFLRRIRSIRTGITDFQSSIQQARKDTEVYIAIHPHSKKTVELAENIAPSDLTVLITGPTGSGKDQLARYIHACSHRKGGLITVNCSAIPEGMIESELFGYGKGAFTGADRDRTGLFEEADGGTFYLNEIADATPQFQAKLLEVIERKTIRPLGRNETRPVDIRIIAATNCDLERFIREGRFRLDLYHRLNEISITLFPLGERKSDIPALTEHFLIRAGYSPEAETERYIERLGKILMLRPWPGNVRQLASEVNRLWITSKGNILNMVALALKDDFESEEDQLLEILEQTGWNRSEAARILGVSEGTVRIRIKKYGLKKH
jgi:DNA-binding NtrC family response regulator